MPEISSSSFSETDANNNAPAPNGFPENMPFSGVNDSARALMAATKRMWGRLNGRYASGGSANAYSLTPDGALAAYTLGERYSFRANFSNTGAATLNISGLGAKAIKKMTASGKADLASGDIQSGQPVTAEYDGTDMVMVTLPANSVLPAAGSAGNVLASDGTGWTSSVSSLVPVGALMPYAGTAAPTGWLLCFGQAISRTTYAALFAAIGTTYGAGDGSTTFNIPDLRGRVAAGKDDMGGTAANRLTNLGTGNAGINGSVLGFAGGTDRHAINLNQMPSHTHAVATHNNSGGVGTLIQRASPTSDTNAASPGLAPAGNDEPHPNVQPTIVLYYVIKV